MQVFLNGQLVPKDDAKISVFDRGFLFGDGVYEVIPVCGDKLFCFEEHITRLNNSLVALNIKNPYNQDDWQKICDDVINECKLKCIDKEGKQVTDNLPNPHNLDGDVRVALFHGIKERNNLTGYSLTMPELHGAPKRPVWGQIIK